KLNSQINMAHFNLAQLCEAQKKYQEAESEYRQELQVSPKNFKAQFNLGRLYLNEGRLAEGIVELQAAIKSAPDFALGYLFLAQAYVESDQNLEDALQFAQKGVSLNKDPEYRPLGHLVL